MANDKVVTRLRYDDELKAKVIAERAAPGASVAEVTMSHGINANLAREAGTPVGVLTCEFVAVSLALLCPTCQERY